MTDQNDQAQVGIEKEIDAQGAESRDEIGYEEQRAAALSRSRAQQDNRRAILRLFVMGLVLLVIGIVATIIITQILRGSRKKPIDFKLYPGSVLVSQQNDDGKSGTSDLHTYATSDALQTVVDFYSKEYGAATQDNGEGCRIEPDQKQTGGCAVDNSQDDQTQRILIRFGIDPKSKKTIIEVRRDWGG